MKGFWQSGKMGTILAVSEFSPGLRSAQGFYPEARRLLLIDAQERTQSSASAGHGLIPVSSTGWTIV
jgi:hypothetical protein